MDMSFSPEDLAFRDEVRSFIAGNYPAPSSVARTRGEMTKEDILGWHRVLYRKGWVAPHWPVQYGGTGWSITQRYIWNEENARAETMPLLPFGLTMVGPVIYTFGNEEQKKRFLPGILSGDDWWCQGYSEPGAGSDLASLKTRAVRDGDHYVVNGHKIWTTWAHWADWMFALVRTNQEAKAQEGISFVLIDMKSPGITVRPIISADGCHDLNEVFFDNVKVPLDNLVGEENKGWTIAKFLLGFERAEMAAVGLCKRLLQFCRKAAQAHYLEGRPLWDDALIRHRLAELEMRVKVHEWTTLRVLASEERGTTASAAPSMLKLASSELQQDLTRLLRDCTGPRGTQYLQALRQGEAVELEDQRAFDNALVANYIDWRKVTVYGGTTEVQKTITAKTFA